VSESNKKIIPISRQQPVQRRRRKRQVPKAGDKKPNNQKALPPSSANPIISSISHNTSGRPIPNGGRRPTSQVMIPTVVKTVPQVSTQKSNPLGNPRLRTVRVEKPQIQRRTSRRTRLKPMAKTMLYALRLLIIGVGIGAIVGTVLSVLDPANRLNTIASVSSTNQAPKPPQNNTSSFTISQEIPDLKENIQKLITANSDLNTGVFLLDVDNGNYLDINANNAFSAASTIKIPILIAFFQDVDAGKIRLDEMLTLEKEMIGSGSGNMQYQEPGTKYTALDVATRMMTISDNTATNMVIAKLGGKEILNQRFSSWGLTNTNIRNPLPDLEGTNTTSPKELGMLISMLSQGNFVTMRSRDLILSIMNQTQRNNLLVAGLGKGAKAYHKTGDIGTMLGDAGLIDIPTGKRYIVTVMVQRPKNDQRATTLINSISSTAYQYFSQTQVIPTTSINNTNNNLPITNYPQNTRPLQQPGMVNNIPVSNYPAPIMTPQQYNR
jgi:beta-lactamase class A